MALKPYKDFIKASGQFLPHKTADGDTEMHHDIHMFEKEQREKWVQPFLSHVSQHWFLWWSFTRVKNSILNSIHN